MKYRGIRKLVYSQGFEVEARTRAEAIAIVRDTSGTDKTRFDDEEIVGITVTVIAKGESK